MKGEEKFLPRFKIEGELIFARSPVFLTNFLISRRLIIKENEEGGKVERPRTKINTEMEGRERKKKRNPLPPVSRTPRQWVAINPNSGLLIMHTDELFGCPVFLGVNQLLLFSPRPFISYGRRRTNPRRNQGLLASLPVCQISRTSIRRLNK